MAELKSTGEILRDSIYDWLWKDFVQFSLSLNDEQRVELDGKLWKLATTLADAGMYQSLLDTVGKAALGGTKAAHS